MKKCGWLLLSLFLASCSPSRTGSTPTGPAQGELVTADQGPGGGGSGSGGSGQGGSFDPRQVVVELAPGTSITTINRRYGTQTIAKLTDEPIYLLRVPSGKTVNDLLPAMTEDPALVTAEPNYRAENPEAQGSSMTFADPSLDPADYADQAMLKRIRVPGAHTLVKARGSGVIVAVLDTGIQSNHPQIAGRIAPGGIDLVDGDSNPADVKDGIDSDSDGLVDEAAGHGTFVAGLVLSVAPRASILPIRVLDSDGFGTSFAVARGIEAAHRGGARVINMSFRMDDTPDIVDQLIGELENDGVVFIASAGNLNSDQPQQFPARDSHVVGVAATDPSDRKAGFSNFGSWVDVSAPGVGLVSFFPAGAFAPWSGTSFATALVSGEAALLFSDRPGARSDDVVDAIEESAVVIDRLNPAFDGELGSGRIDVQAAVKWLRGR
jgi:subtilisin family serine protease